jgi:glycosyltransferase involved in cell wall biosynthesis
VITPIHTSDHKLPQIRQALSSATHPAELIVVINNPDLTEHIVSQIPNELVVIAPRKGRGFAFLQGIANIKGEITLLLHSDTIPPLGWDESILNAMKDPQVAGGGFSMTYETPDPFLDFICWFSNQWARLTGEIYGDRGMFVRSHILRHCLSALEVPIFEDVRLAHCMRNHGRAILLNDKAVTSEEGYRKYGLLQYIGRVWRSRIWHALGVSPFKIYNYYYSKP